MTTNYGYDNIYELLSATQGGTTTESYTYDPVGNRLSSLGVANYTNNTSNELTSTSNATYTYDYNGNLTSKTDSTGTTNYNWDFENRLTQVTLPGSGGTISFAYDPFGRRIKKVTASTTSVFAYDGDNLIEETNASGVAVARYEQTQDIDELLAMLRSGATSYYDADGLGSITSLANSAGSLAQTYTFDSFGKLTGSSGSLTNPFQYTARENDTETGLYYYRARYYDQTIGRFLTEDVIRFQGGIDFYAYVRNTPTIFADPLGLAKIDPSCNCSGGWNKNSLSLAIQLAAAGAGRITDIGLRDCILAKLGNNEDDGTGVVKCDTGGCNKHQIPDKNGKVWAGWALPRGNTINLCKAAQGSDFSLACTMVHEFAHTCSKKLWPFGEGRPNRAENQAFPGLCPQ